MLAASQDLVSAARLTRKTALRGRDEISPHCGWALALEVRGMRRESRHAYDGEVMDLIFDEFGNVLSESGDTTLLPHGFAGGMWDRDTGLVRFGARDYDAYTGRWTARDPILFAGGQANLYAYVDNDPINRIDPSGLSWWNDVWDYLNDALGGANDFRRNYGDMRDANTIGADKYFHCKANCEAASRGPGGVDMSELISEGREWTDEHFKGDPRSACDEDRAANDHGRNGGRNRGGACETVCSPFRPRGLDPRY